MADTGCDGVRLAVTAVTAVTPAPLLWPSHAVSAVTIAARHFTKRVAAPSGGQCWQNGMYWRCTISLPRYRDAGNV